MIDLPKKITDFMTIFQKKGFQIYIVGGAMRNLLLGKKTLGEKNNWDFTTNAPPEQILAIFPDAYYNNTYGTVTIPIDKDLFEVTTFRRESKYKDFRHPEEITWAKTIEEDLSRRDFTINAMAYDGNKIIDLFKGQEHLKKKLIIAVGDPDVRFHEDGLRLIRGVRFASQLGFLIEEKTRISMIKNSSLIKKISWERIRDELMKILSSDNPAEGIVFLKNTHLLKHILPELDDCFSIPQKSPKRHHIYDVGTHMIMSLKNCPSKDQIVRLATLLHDIGKQSTYKKDKKTSLITFYNHEVAGKILAEKIARRLRLSNKDREKFVQLIAYHQFTVSETISDKAVRRFIRDLGKEYIHDMLDLRTGDRIGSGATPTSWRFELFKKRLIEVQKEPFKITDLKIDGNQIMKILKIKPGPQIGKILKAVFQQVVDKKIENKKEVLQNFIKSEKFD